MKEQELIPNLFREEYSKIVAVLCKRYGLANIQFAEDFVSDSFLKAAETWGLKGTPQNPKAWLHEVARNKARDYFRRKHIYQSKVAPELSNQNSTTPEADLDLSDRNIQDSQLQMIFAICNPLNTNESQIALALRILCGFGIGEIANALLSNKATINKRLFRAKSKLREQKVGLAFPPPHELENRLANVLSILYLLFNEGYYATSSPDKIRKDLCAEAMRLLYLLTENEKTNTAQTSALMALFCFHASRFEARTDEFGGAILFEDQDRQKWNQELIFRGETYLNRSQVDGRYSKYHFEALIAFFHTRILLPEKEKWEHILQFYNRLLQVEYSPVAALNRTYALARVEGKEVALKAALKIDLGDSHLYHALLAELYQGSDVELERAHLEQAIALAENEQDRKVLEGKLERLK